MRSADAIQCRMMANAIFSIGKICWDTDYLSNNSDIKIYIPQINSFVYPNGVVVFDKIELYKQKEDVVTNPILIAEMASSSVYEYECSKNFFYYQSLPSFSGIYQN